MKAIMRRNYICVRKNLYILYEAYAFFKEKQRRFYQMIKPLHYIYTNKFLPLFVANTFVIIVYDRRLSIILEIRIDS